MSSIFTGETPLIHAARQGHTDTAKFLLEHGADPAIASNLGATALHHSAGIGEPLFSLFAFFCPSSSFLFQTCILLILGEVPVFIIAFNVILPCNN